MPMFFRVSFQIFPYRYPMGTGVKRPGREADHSPPSSAEVKNARSCTSIPSIPLHDVVLN
jgi:hypothetical protein